MTGSFQLAILRAIGATAQTLPNPYIALAFSADANFKDLTRYPTPPAKLDRWGISVAFWWTLAGQRPAPRASRCLGWLEWTELAPVLPARPSSAAPAALDPAARCA